MLQGHMTPRPWPASGLAGANIPTGGCHEDRPVPHRRRPGVAFSPDGLPAVRSWPTVERPPSDWKADREEAPGVEENAGAFLVPLCSARRPAQALTPRRSLGIVPPPHPGRRSRAGLMPSRSRPFLLAPLGPRDGPPVSSRRRKGQAAVPGGSCQPGRPACSQRRRPAFFITAPSAIFWPPHWHLCGAA
jgi:hypothetical protein